MLFVNKTLFGHWLSLWEVMPFVFSLKISLSLAIDVVYTLSLSHTHTIGCSLYHKLLQFRRWETAYGARGEQKHGQGN